MSLDITWCSGKRCPKEKKERCERWEGRLQKIVADKPKEGLYVSMAEFSDHDGSCRLEKERAERL